MLDGRGKTLFVTQCDARDARGTMEQLEFAIPTAPVFSGAGSVVPSGDDPQVRLRKRWDSSSTELFDRSVYLMRYQEPRHACGDVTR